MTEIRIDDNTNFYREIMPWLVAQGIEYTYFSRRRIVALHSDEDAVALVLQFGGKPQSAIGEMLKEFEDMKRRG